jgi:hypothetical protein
MKIHYYLISLFVWVSSTACDDGPKNQSESVDCREEAYQCPQGERCETDESGEYLCVRDTMGGEMIGGEMVGGEMVGGEMAGGEGMGGEMVGGEAMGGEVTSGEMMGGETLPGGGEGPQDPLATEHRQLNIPMDDPTDPRTVSTVLGLRRGYAEDATTIILDFGASLNAPEAGQSEGYHIYSPDDERYALELLIEPSAVTLSELENPLPIPLDAQGRAYMLYQLRLNLSEPLLDGARYFVRAIGGYRVELNPAMHHRDPWGGYPITSGRNAINFTFGESEMNSIEASETLIAQVMGLRELTVVGPRHIRLLIGASALQSLLDEPSNFTIISTEDESYQGGAQALSVGRRSYPEGFVPGYGYPFPRKLNRHEVYLELPVSLSEGINYTVSIDEAVVPAASSLSFIYSDDLTRNHHLKVNQLGYRADSPVKLALIGAWMGSLGTLSGSELDGRSCFIVDTSSGEEVFESILSLRHDATTQDEGAYQENFAHEALFQCDFSDFQESGTYFVKIEGAGRSYDFEIGDGIYREAFRTAMRGIFYQRSGQALNGDNSMFRRVASHVEPISIPYMDDKSIIGGHYDAGDFNPRVHPELMHILMLGYEIFPQKFYDGQLDIPENNNGVPDLLDEVEWGLQTLVALQDEDGGVGYDAERNMFIESKNDPNFVEVAERDPYLQETFDKHPIGTLITAALAATASRLWESIGDSVKASMYLDVSTRAYAWAKDNGADEYVYEYAWAAAELAKTTRETIYLEDFRASGYALEGIFDDGNIQRLRPALTLALDTAEEADFELSNLMYTQVRSVADTLMRFNNYAYPHFQHPYAPVNWGTAAYPISIETMVAMWVMSLNDSYLEMMIHSADFSLGLNPLNQSWTTGLGDNPIYGVCHLFAWHNFQGVIPPGLHSEGPNHDGDYIERFANENHPRPADTPKYYNYYDVRYLIGLNEGVVKNQAWTAFLYGALLPDHPQE